MHDDDCIRLLREVLPRLGMRWPGFRKPRGQVCKRIARRMAELGEGSVDGYLGRLEEHPDEWEVLDFLCRVTISRFRRDRRTWERLEGEVLPSLAERLEGEDGGRLRCWSAGCASGEEPYTLSLLWELGGLARRFPGVEPFVLATDLDPHMVFRARRGVYPPGALKELPGEWVGEAFEPVNAGGSRGGGSGQGEAETGEPAELRLRGRFRRPVRLVCADLRDPLPRARFHLVLCRNLPFTYYRKDLQERLLGALSRRVVPGGWLAVGAHEELPRAWQERHGWRGRGEGLYRRARTGRMEGSEP